MADDDEIDILGDFSFNSCLAQNNQGIPSCSDREDTVHPQWLLDSTATNWYDTQNRFKQGPSRKLSGNSSKPNNDRSITEWSSKERDILNHEMVKYGRNVKRIAQTLKTKSEIEIRALIEAEHGVNLDNDHDIPPASVSEVLSMVSTGEPTVNVPMVRKFMPLITPKPNSANIHVNPCEIFYDNDLVIGSTESVASVANQSNSPQKNKNNVIRKIRRKQVKALDKGGQKNKSKLTLKSPQGRIHKDSNMLDDSVKNPKLQIVLGSGQALLVSEGEQVIKIEKKKDLEQESDIEIDIDSDEGLEAKPKFIDKPATQIIDRNDIPQKHVDEIGLVTDNVQERESGPTALPLRRLDVLRRRRKINLDGEGGYRILHTEDGDLYEISSEPRRERQARKQPVHLIRCRTYGPEKPAPCEVHLHVSTLVCMEVHAHMSRGEVMGLVGGGAGSRGVHLTAYRPARAAANTTHCDMDPVSQAMAGEHLRALGLAVCGWHHSHPQFPAEPSRRDLRTQRELQAALRWSLPFLALITSQRWPHHRYSCFRVEDTERDGDTPVGYQFDVKLVADLTALTLPDHLLNLAHLRDMEPAALALDMRTDVCPLANITYIDKCVWSVSRYMRAAGYGDRDPVLRDLVRGIRDIFR